MSLSDGKFQRAKILQMISLEVSTLKPRIIDYRLGCRVSVFIVYIFSDLDLNLSERRYRNFSILHYL